jgi:tetratricopeptide (TPR) repeat protein
MRSLKNISQEEFEKLESYAMGTMDSSNTDLFEAELETNSELKNQLQEVRALIIGIESAVLKDKLNDFHEELNPVHNLVSSPVNSRRILKWAAAAIFIVAVGFLWMLNSGSENEKLFAKHFKPDPGLPTTMSSNSNFSFYDGMVDYKRGDYTSAIQKWEDLVATEQSPSDTLNYFLGVAYLANKNAPNAIHYLEATLQQDKSMFQKETYFYLGLAFLKQNEMESAKHYLGLSGLEASEAILSKLSKR